MFFLIIGKEKSIGLYTTKSGFYKKNLTCWTCGNWPRTCGWWAVWRGQWWTGRWGQYRPRGQSHTSCPVQGHNWTHHNVLYSVMNEWMKVYLEHCTQNIINNNKTQYKQTHLSTILQCFNCFGPFTNTYLYYGYNNLCNVMEYMFISKS